MPSGGAPEGNLTVLHDPHRRLRHEIAAGVQVRRFVPCSRKSLKRPGYVSSFRYYRASGVTIAFQINTDKGVLGSGKDVLGDILERIMRVLVGNANHANPGHPTARPVPRF